MSYKIRFRDRTEIIVPTEAGEELVKALAEGKPPENVVIFGSLYRRTEILSISPAQLDPRPDVKALPKSTCRGEHSIQWAIHKIAKRSSNWPKLVQDKAWRDKIRSELRAKYPDRKWCDYKAKECACN